MFNRPSALRFHLDCEGRPRGVADAEVACRRLEREWLAFLPPVATDTVCAGGLTDQMTIRGTIGGVKVSRDYSNCYAEMTLS